MLPYEISLARTPAFEDALVLAAGADAMSTWELLSEASVVSVADPKRGSGLRMRPVTPARSRATSIQLEIFSAPST
jgi:hypothetical protein